MRKSFYLNDRNPCSIKAIEILNKKMFYSSLSNNGSVKKHEFEAVVSNLRDFEEITSLLVFEPRYFGMLQSRTRIFHA